MFSRCTFLVITSLLVSGSFPAIAQTPSSSCVPLHVVGGEGTQVKKSVSPPGLLVNRNNWNTDFAVPGGTTFRNFTATIVPSDSASYNVAVYLKYSDKTSEQLYKQTSVKLDKGQPLKVSGSPPSNKQPYQVNIEVGGTTKLGHSYTASAVGCP